MASNPRIADINDLVNFAVDQKVISLDEAETFVRDLVAAYAIGAPYRDDDQTPGARLLAFGSPRTQRAPIDKLERQFVWLRHKIEEDTTWQINPLLELFEELEFAVFQAVAEREEAVRRLQTFPTKSMQ